MSTESTLETLADRWLKEAASNSNIDTAITSIVSEAIDNLQLNETGLFKALLEHAKESVKQASSAGNAQ